MANEQEIPQAVREAAAAAVDDIDNAMHGGPDRKLTPVVQMRAVTEAADALADHVEDGITFLQEHGERLDFPDDSSRYFYISPRVAIDNRHEVEFFGVLPSSEPPRGPFSFQTRAILSPEVTEKRTTSVSVRGEIVPDGSITVYQTSIRLRSEGITSQDGIAKMPRHGANVTTLIDFASAALPPHQNRNTMS